MAQLAVKIVSADEGKLDCGYDLTLIAQCDFDEP